LFEDPVLAAFHRRHGPAPFQPNPVPERPLFQVLAESIVAQQLSAKAAATLTERLWMFGLGRPDVWPVGDLGMQKAARALFGVAREDLPRFGEAFRPYRSHLAWYLWRSLE
jgi:3-methyladenine DNA glycosylase/8-oxoguanine DNA glycosylase